MFNSCGCRDVVAERSFFHDDAQVLLPNDQVKIFEWIAINLEELGGVAFLSPPSGNMI